MKTSKKQTLLRVKLSVKYIFKVIAKKLANNANKYHLLVLLNVGYISMLKHFTQGVLRNKSLSIERFKRIG